MSSKMPYYAIDKVAATVTIDAKSRAKWDKRAMESGKSVTTLMAMFLEAEVRDDPFTVDDMERADEYMRDNIRKREARKARKGVVK